MLPLNKKHKANLFPYLTLMSHKTLLFVLLCAQSLLPGLVLLLPLSMLLSNVLAERLPN